MEQQIKQFGTPEQHQELESLLPSGSGCYASKIETTTFDGLKEVIYKIVNHPEHGLLIVVENAKSIEDCYSIQAFEKSVIDDIIEQVKTAKYILSAENTESLRQTIEDLNKQTKLDITPAGLDDFSTDIFMFSDGAIDCQDMIVMTTANRGSNFKMLSEAEFINAIKTKYNIN